MFASTCVIFSSLHLCTVVYWWCSRTISLVITYKLVRSWNNFLMLPTWENRTSKRLHTSHVSDEDWIMNSSVVPILLAQKYRMIQLTPSVVLTSEVLNTMFELQNHHVDFCWTLLVMKEGDSCCTTNLCGIFWPGDLVLQKCAWQFHVMPGTFMSYTGICTMR